MSKTAANVFRSERKEEKEEMRQNKTRGKRE